MVVVSPMSTKKFVDYVKRGRCTIHLGLHIGKKFSCLNSNIEEVRENLKTTFKQNMIICN